MPERSLQQLFLERSDLFATMKHHLVVSRRASQFLDSIGFELSPLVPLKLDLLATWSVARILPFSIQRCPRERALGGSNGLS